MCSLPAGLEALAELKDSGLTLHDHQIEGVQKILEWHKNGHGGILADEMGLGKTCQTVCSLVILSKTIKDPKFVIICPLSVIEHWENEVIRFGCGIFKPFVYKGSKEIRHELRNSRFMKNDWNVLLTTYSYFRLDASLMKFTMDVFVIDEAHSVKNQMSQIHQLVRHRHAKFHLLLTGTPIQNDLEEFYSLLSLADAPNYPEDGKENFMSQDKASLLQSIKMATDLYVLRRLKTKVIRDLPPVQEVILKHGLTTFQRDLYNAILVNNRAFFNKTKASRQSLMSPLVQLRKAVSHPYLFKGVEPEPFVEGEHLFTSSGKFMVLDKLLQFLKKKGHRILIFSQFARTLEILSDALSLRGYKFEHFDGSTKAEARFQAIDNFQRRKSDVFCFLISTKAGGMGLTLTGADTVIFVDSDLNPQNDLQAAARCHRIGQDKPVKVIHLLTEHTIDDAIYKRSANKLKLSEFVLEDKQGLVDTAGLREVLLSDLAKLNQTEDCSEHTYKLLTDDYFVTHIGETDENNHWLNEAVRGESAEGGDGDRDHDIELFPRAEPILHKRIAVEDEATFDNLVTKLKGHNISNDTRLRRAVKSSAAAASTSRLNPAEAAERKKQRMAEAAAKRLAEDKKREEAKKKLWEDNFYESLNVKFLLKNAPVNVRDEIPGRLYRVFGTIVDPVRSTTDNSSEAWILHSVDKGGHWGTGGLFTLIQNTSQQVPTAYEFAARMGDLHIGDSVFLERLVPNQDSSTISLKAEVDLDEEKLHGLAAEKLSRKLCFQLMVTQSLRDKQRLLLSESNLKSCFKNMAQFAKTRAVTPSIHMAKVWFGIPTLSEKTVCKMVVKYLCKQGIDVYIYHYQRHQQGHRGGRTAAGATVRQPANLGQQPVHRTTTNQQTGPPAKKRRVQIVDDEDEDVIVLDDGEEEVESETASEGGESIDIDLSDEEEDVVEDENMLAMFDGQ